VAQEAFGSIATVAHTRRDGSQVSKSWGQSSSPPLNCSPHPSSAVSGCVLVMDVDGSLSTTAARIAGVGAAWRFAVTERRRVVIGDGFDAWSGKMQLMRFLTSR